MNILDNLNLATSHVDNLIKENPEYGLWRSIRAQLDFIDNDFDSDGVFKNSASIDTVKKIILGVVAVREIDSDNPEFADILCQIDYQYKKLYKI